MGSAILVFATAFGGEMEHLYQNHCGEYRVQEPVMYRCRVPEMVPLGAPLL